MMRSMSQPERKSFPELLSAIPPEDRGDLSLLRPLFEEFMLQTPLPSDVSLTEMTLGGVPALEISVPEATTDAALLYFHGGVFALGSARASAGLASPARATGSREGALRRLPARPRASIPGSPRRRASVVPRPARHEASARSGSLCLGESAGGALALGTLIAARDSRARAAGRSGAVLTVA